VPRLFFTCTWTEGFQRSGTVRLDQTSVLAAPGTIGRAWRTCFCGVRSTFAATVVEVHGVIHRSPPSSAVPRDANPFFCKEARERIEHGIMRRRGNASIPLTKDSIWNRKDSYESGNVNEVILVIHADVLRNTCRMEHGKGCASCSRVRVRSTAGWV